MVTISVPPEKRIKFFVYIIESPSPPDMYHGRFEGDMLQKALSLDLIPCSHRIAVSEEAFRAAVIIGLKEQMEEFKDMIPIIHISAHGSAEGLQLTNEQTVTWAALKNLLLPINKALNGNLMLCISSCEGVHACRMAMEEEGDLPFFAVIGHKGKPTWSDTAVGYAAFYHLISKGCYVVDAVEAMREASGENGFKTITAKEARKAFIDAIKEQKAQAAITLLSAQQTSSSLPQRAVDLEKSGRQLK